MPREWNLAWAAWRMYPEWGDVPAAGVLTVIGRYTTTRYGSRQRRDRQSRGILSADHKEGASAQRVAMTFRLPLVYLVDSAGVFLPLQDEIFPDEDDFGRIFRNNAVISASRIPQYAAVMGNCVAGGAYLPVLSDTLLITEGSQRSGRSSVGQGGHRPGRRPGGTRRHEDARRH